MVSESNATGRRGRTDRMPRWLRAVVAAAAIALGVVLLIRPTTTLGVLAFLIGAGMIAVGILEIAAREAETDRPRWRLLTAPAWIAGGLFVLAWPGLTVRLLALVVGVLLIVNGALTLVAALRRARARDTRVADAGFGAAGVVFGVLALSWPDITLLIVAIVFGARLVMSGLADLWQAVRPGAAPGRPGTAPRRARTVGAVVTVVLAVVAAAVSVALHAGSPEVDDFYTAPRVLPDEPGQLIRTEAFTRDVPDDARAWRILYTTTDLEGEVRVASGLVVVPASGDGDWPVIDWSHGTTGVARQCAPSLLAHPFASGALNVLPQIVDEGWALVMTDDIGLGTEGPHPYLIGVPTAHAVLDARRAAGQLAEARLGAQTVVWGHSQGGGGALWTGALADDYAPDVPLAGVAALSPASDLPGLVKGLGDITGGSVFASFVIDAYAALYDDVTYRQYVRPGAEVTVRELATRCLAEPGTAVSLLELLGLSEDPVVMAADPTTGPLGERLKENVPPATITAPLLVGQGAADGLVRPAVQDAFVASLCDAGVSVDYRLYSGRGHTEVVDADSPLVPELFEWTRARLAGDAAEIGCTRTEE
ncbi:DUF308 domain-containing protein [Microbacterium sp.]|uniref:DUF308 domain-containing protein n=1 Tax=Microbacterium sp. TaxID=51671 RepID=UPI0039E53F05